MLRRGAIILSLCLVMLVAGYLYTAHLAQQGIERGLTNWAAQRNEAGWHVTGRIEPSAFSLFGAEVVVRDGDLTIDSALPGGLELGASKIVIRVSPFNPLKVRITIPDQALLRLGRQPATRINSQLLEAVVLLRTRSPQPAPVVRSVTLAGQKLTGSDGSALGSFDATVALNQDGGRLDLRTEAIVLPIDIPVLGRHLSDLTLHAGFSVWPGSLGSAASRADIWRAGGGKITVDSIMVGWGPLGVTGQGSLTLDSNLQPDAGGTLQLRGYQDVLASLGNTGKLAAMVIAASGDQVNVRVKKNQLTVDRLPILKLQKLEW